MLKRVIQYYAPEFLVGLTATDQRPDKKRLEEIFGNYTTELSLKDAMEKGVVARANVYRIETNIDLSHVRFNGKDYVNADLEKSVRVTSRNDLIVNVLKGYFTEGDAGKRQGIIFCINKAHTKEMARLLNAAGISAQDYSGDTKHPEKVMQEFKEHALLAKMSEGDWERVKGQMREDLERYYKDKSNYSAPRLGYINFWSKQRKYNFCFIIALLRKVDNFSM